MFTHKTESIPEVRKHMRYTFSWKDQANTYLFHKALLLIKELTKHHIETKVTDTFLTILYICSTASGLFSDHMYNKPKAKTQTFKFTYIVAD